MTPFTFPFVSVVIPVYNGVKNIDYCLQALLKLEYPPEKREIIIVDNNSTDNTPELISHYPVQLASEHEIQTSYAARNRGIQLARGEIVAFADSDCMPDPSWLKCIAQAFIDPQIAGVAGKVIPCPPTNLVEEFLVALDPLRFQILGKRISMCTANVAYRREILIQLGGFRSRLPTGGDIDLGWRVQDLPGWRVRYADDVIVYHKNRSNVSELCKLYRRYGYSEILIDTLHRHDDAYPRTPRKQLVIMLHQFKALIIYLLSFILRLARCLIRGWDKRYMIWPILWFLVDGSSLCGKLQGILETQFWTTCM